MAESWMYDGFPLKRADSTTRGDDYQYVIQSMDAALRHTFNFPAGVAITPPFSINEHGDVEILQTLSIGSTVPINEIVDSIPLTPEDADSARLANVASIRTYTGEYIDDYLTTQGLFVERAGDTMTGALLADGGISASADLEISNAVFITNPALAAGMALQSNLGVDLIKFSSAVVVGDATESLQMTGAGGRPTYKGENVAFVSDIVGVIPGIDYVPEAGGTFTGLVSFDTGLLISSGNPITMEYNSGASSFTLVQVGTDALGDVIFDAADNFEFQGAVLAEQFDLDIDGGRETVLAFSSDEIQVGHASKDINLFGDGTRPLYNDLEIALLTDAAGTYVAGSGITFTDVGGDTDEIAITPGGITVLHLPGSPDDGQYLRTAPGGALSWSNLDIVAGTGMAVTTTGATKQVEVAINDDGVDTLQIADAAVTQPKIDTDAIDWDQLDADRTIPTSTAGLYTLIVDTNGTPELQWQKGGAAGVLGSLAVVDDWGATNSTSVLEEDFNESDGPYMITEIIVSNTGSGTNTIMEVYIDGTLVIDDTYAYTETDIIKNDAGAIFDYPFFAKESVEVKHMISGTSRIVRVDVRAIRMG